jgi:hypothetical protein
LTPHTCDTLNVDLFEIFYAQSESCASYLSPVMVSNHEDAEVTFDGSNWQDLNRLVAISKFQFIQDDDYDDNEARKCAYLAQKFTGPALDWVSSTHTSTQGAAFVSFDLFVIAAREAFGIADNNITALLRRDLDNLEWQPEVPTFFAEFDRLTLALGINSHETRIAMIEQKLPLRLKVLLAEQSLSFSNYDTMRERFNGMWAMDPTRGKKVTQGSKKPRCGSCGKKGHVASDCRAKTKN